MRPQFLFQIARGNFLYLLVSLLLLLLLAPLFEGTPMGSIIVSIAFSAILLSALYAVSPGKSMFTLSVMFVVFLILMRWSNHLLQSHVLGLVIKLLMIMFLVVTMCAMFAHILAAGKVTANKICGALSVYLVIGVTWALLYTVIEGIHPQSFAIADSHVARSHEITLFTYYSFVTLTTLGFGDIIPLTPIAKVFTYIEAVFGQIYLAVLIARLVGLHIVHSSGN